MVKDLQDRQDRQKSDNTNKTDDDEIDKIDRIRSKSFCKVILEQIHKKQESNLLYMTLSILFFVPLCHMEMKSFSHYGNKPNAVKPVKSVVCSFFAHIGKIIFIANIK